MIVLIAQHLLILIFIPMTNILFFITPVQMQIH